jgi:Fe-S cluster biosynthesis and repair protein YggX
MENKEPLAEQPMPGSTGERILEEICRDCWNEWRELVPQLINHYGLNLGNPEHRKELRRVMKEFLNFGDEEAGNT